MYPTLYDKQIVLLRKWGYQPRINDVVIIHDNELKTNIIKRIVAIDGDHLIIKDNQLIVNDEIIEGYQGITSLYDLDIYIPNNSIFVIGDNFEESTDSRSLGVFNYHQILGKVIY